MRQSFYKSPFYVCYNNLIANYLSSIQAIISLPRNCRIHPVMSVITIPIATLSYLNLTHPTSSAHPAQASP